MNPLTSHFRRAPSIRPKLNIGMLIDIQNGTYVKGTRGESILDGGMPFLTGVAGQGNTNKSTVTHAMNLTVLERYGQSNLNVYDTEFTVSPARFNMLAWAQPTLKDIDLAHYDRFMISDPSAMTANEWFDSIRSLAEARRKEASKIQRETPFLDTQTGQPYYWFDPFLSEVDSLSMFMTDNVEDIYVKNEIGDSKTNMVNMTDARTKSAMVMQLMGLTASAGIYQSFTMHVGEQHQMDPYSPPNRQLRYLKNKLKIKNVPEKISFLLNSLWMINYANPMINQGTKAPEFPRDQSDDLKGDTDLTLVGIQGLRIKNGQSGLPFEWIVSQTQGLLVGLSEFWYLKCYDRFGISGNDRNYHLDLYPDVNLSRTTVRGKIEQDAKLKRALEISSELCQMRNLWNNDLELWCDPKTLFEDLKQQGYDWDQLLGETRGYWIFREDEKDHPLKFCSTMDLLRMRAGLYKPYWME